MRLLIRNGRVLDPSCGRDEICDLLAEDGLIVRVAKKMEGIPEESAGRNCGDHAESGRPEEGAKLTVVDAAGCFVMPGLVDLHVHLRDPGLTYKEDIASGSRAAARGGYTTILAMPNTKPVIDTPDKVQYVINKAMEVAPIHVLQVGAVTMGQKGEEVSDIRGMAEAGIPAISEDGKSVMNAEVYREAMEIASELDLPVLAHCEDIHMVCGGVMNDDDQARQLGLPGIRNAVEDVIVARDIVLAKETGARLHLCHCSTRDSVQMVRAAKNAGIKVSAEVCPHHFTLTSDDIKKDDANYKMNPPVRTAADRDALIAGLKDGTIDAIATDHAPHSAEEKNRSMRQAPFGIVGLETAVPLTITRLVETGVLTPLDMARVMSYQPARIAGLEAGTLAEGAAADIVLIDPSEEYVIDKEEFASRGRNTPFDGWKVRGRVKMTICGGRIVYEACRGDDGKSD